MKDVKQTLPEEKFYPSYYSILTASVRYDKELPDGAKILFSEITALCNKKGYCYASNRYFAGLYNKTNTTVSTWIKKLIDRGHITASYINGMRKMWIPEQTSHSYPTQIPKPKTEAQEQFEIEQEHQVRMQQQQDKFKKDQEAYEADPATPEEIQEELRKAKLLVSNNQKVA